MIQINRLIWLFFPIAISGFWLLDYFATPTIVHHEMFLIQPSLDRPGFQKFFDVCGLDICLGRLRPLSYFFEWIDFKVQDISYFETGYFRSLTHFIFSILTALVFYRAISGFLSKRLSLFLSIFLISSPAWLMAQRILFRAGKPITGFTVAFLTMIYFRPISNLKWKVAFACILSLLTLGDEQSLLWIGIFSLIIFLKQDLRKQWGWVMASSLCFYGLFYVFLRPYIFEWASPGQEIIQATSLGFLRWDERVLRKAFHVILTQPSMLFGNMGISFLVAPLLILGLLRKSDWFLCLSIPLGLGMVYLLGVRHVAFVWEDVAIAGYYHLGWSVIWMALFAVFIKAYQTRENAILALLVLIWSAGFFGIQKTQDQVWNGPTFLRSVAETQVSRKALKNEPMSEDEKRLYSNDIQKWVELVGHHNF